MAENKVRAARFSPDIQEKLDAYQSVFAWDFGQTVTQLLNYRDRINTVLTRITVVRQSDGSDELFYDWPDEEDADRPMNADRVCLWLVQELKKSIAEGFREPFMGVAEPWEE